MLNRFCLALFAAFLIAREAAAETAPVADLEVDVELVLAVDVSRSMSPAELEIQRRGYAEALVSDEVLSTIGNGLIGQIALTYIEWAGVSHHNVVVPWTLIDSVETAQAVSDRLTAQFDGNMRRTSIAAALDMAVRAFDDNGFVGLRRVIDISGDGPNNQGGPVELARDAALSQGIVINGLPLMTQDTFSARWGIDDLDVYYMRCVIGGPGAFVIPVYDWSEFSRAVKRKLVLEIAAAPPSSAPAALPERLIRAESYDCLIGEKIWERNRMDWGLP
jgi:hypothetical protein